MNRHNWMPGIRKILSNRAKVLPSERFDRFCSPALVGDCILWNGTTREGTPGFVYGAIKVCGKMIRAHRYAYEREHGPIDEGMVVDHTCENTLCVNPAHLEQVTVVENLRRGRLRRKQAGQAG